jgi:hypothetical protein
MHKNFNFQEVYVFCRLLGPWGPAIKKAGFSKLLKLLSLGSISRDDGADQLMSAETSLQRSGTGFGPGPGTLKRRGSCPLGSDPGR